MFVALLSTLIFESALPVVSQELPFLPEEERGSRGSGR